MVRWAVATESLTIAFYGPETEGGEIDARRLGAALVSFGSLLDAAKAADQDLKDQPLSVVVKGTDEGSFDVQIILEGIGTAWDAVRAWAIGPDGTAAGVLSGFLGTILGFLALIKNTNGSRPDPVQSTAADFTYEGSDGTRITCSIEVLKLLLNAPAVRSARDFVDTLDDDVNKAAIITNVAPKLELTKDDRPAFREMAHSLDDEGDDEPVHRETTISPASVVFDGKGQWAVTEYGQRYRAKMNDPDFAHLVQDENWPIAHSDEYRVNLLSTSHVTPTGQRRWSHSIESVMTYRKSHGEAFRALPRPRRGLSG